VGVGVGVDACARANGLITIFVIFIHGEVTTNSGIRHVERAAKQNG